MTPYCALFCIILLGAFVEDTDGTYPINNPITYNNPFYYPYGNAYPNVYNQIRPYPYWPVSVQQIPNQYIEPSFYQPFYVKCGLVSHLYVCCLFGTRYRCMPLEQIYPVIKDPEDYDYNTEDDNSNKEDGSGQTETAPGMPPPAKRSAIADDFVFTSP